LVDANIKSLQTMSGKKRVRSTSLLFLLPRIRADSRDVIDDIIRGRAARQRHLEQAIHFHDLAEKTVEMIAATIVIRESLLATEKQVCVFGVSSMRLR
jgi:hypothetical protein